jgi:hypothetical protein
VIDELNRQSTLHESLGKVLTAHETLERLAGSSILAHAFGDPLRSKHGPIAFFPTLVRKNDDQASRPHREPELFPLEPPPAVSSGFRPSDTSGPLELLICDPDRQRTTSLRIMYGQDSKGQPRIAIIRGRTKAYLAKALIEQPNQDHTWRALAKMGMSAGYWVLTNPKSLQRAGQRIQSMLPAGLKGRWQQSERGARWDSS